MKPRVLIVDDDERNLTLLSVKMKREGYEVDTASNGIEGLKKIQTFGPDIILMDVMMPQMDGYEALRLMKSKEDTKYIPVIMLTGRTEIEDKVLGFEVGAEDYINKPYSLAEVSARVKSLLRMRALQTRLRETEKMAALGEMVDGIAHEIRNPLTTIGGMARRLYESETDEQHRTYADRIIKSVERLESMVHRIDEYKKILTSTLARGDVNKVIEDAVAEARAFVELSRGSVQIKTRLMPEPPEIYMDYGNLKTAIYNILQNSIEAIEDHGEITVETLPAIDQSLSIRITDTGIGMGEDEVRKIFSPFQTSKMKGAGLGLTICHRIITDHGGEINVTSKKGEGTTVLIKLHPASGMEEPGPVPERR